MGTLQAALAAVAHRLVDDGTVPGLVVATARGDDTEIMAVGRLAFDGPPVTADSLWRVASTTKPVIAVAALALAADGLLSIDDPVDDLLPELAGRRVLRRMDGPLDDTVPASRPVTARDLLTFTLGFGMTMRMWAAPELWPVAVAAAPLCTLGPPDYEAMPGVDEWMALLGGLPLMAQPGTHWLYNTSASVLGVLVARAAGAPLGEVLRDRVLGPLGMVDTGFRAADPARLATAYARAPEGLVVTDRPDGTWSREPAFPDGAGGLVSSAGDLLRLGRCLLGGGAPILDAEAVRAMTSPQVTADQLADAGPFLGRRTWGFCQAVATTGPAAGSYGWDGGLGTSWLVDPSRRQVTVVLTQRQWDDPALPVWHGELQAVARTA